MAQDEDEIDALFGPFGEQRDLSLTFSEHLPESVIADLGLPSARSSRHDDARNRLLARAVLASQRNLWVSFSRRRQFYVGRDRYHGETFRYDTVLSAVADGVNAGFIEEDRALPGLRGRQSRFRATPLLCELLSGCSIESQLHECIWLRDHHRRLVNYTDTAPTRRMRKDVEAINSVMAEIKVDLNADFQQIGSHWIVSGTYLLPTAPRVRRVFNRNSFNKGGRLYGWWQGIPSIDRAHLLLDGEPVLEPDYAQIHAKIIYAMRGFPLIGDAYDTGEFPREFGKRAFNIALNAKNRLGAKAAISKELGIDRRTASRLLAAIDAKHDQVANIFCSDAGVSLMKIDAEITLLSVKQCQARGIAVLPVHDSLIVPAPYAQEAAEIMQEAFAMRFPQASPCEVRIKQNAIPLKPNVIPHNGRPRKRRRWEDPRAGAA
jgi:hypothetical protein